MLLYYLKKYNYKCFKKIFFSKKKTFLFSILGYDSSNEIYKKAFIHKSANRNNNNERLEFLGDAVLSLIIAELLFLENTNKEEGFLSQKRAKIVARKHLNLVGKKIIPDQNIKSRLQKLPQSIYGNTLEAIIGAIYIDKGLQVAIKFVQKHIYNSVFLKELSEIDFKSRLLKYIQTEKFPIEYKVDKQKGLDHEKQFLVSVFINNNKIAEASGRTKKEAEQIAAKKAINIVF